MHIEASRRDPFSLARRRCWAWACVCTRPANALRQRHADSAGGLLRSRDDNHKKDTIVESFTCSSTPVGGQSTEGGGAVARASTKDFHFTHKVDRSSPTLMVAAQKPLGPLTTVPLEFSNPGQHAVVWRAVLTGVSAFSVKPIARPAGAPPVSETTHLTAKNVEPGVLAQPAVRQ